MVQPLVAHWRTQLTSAKSPDEIRRQAREILSGRKYRDVDLDSPLEGPLSKVGDAVRSVFRKIGDIIDRVFPDVSGGSTVVLVVVAIVLAALLARFLIARIDLRKQRAQTNATTGSQNSSAYWERLADEAQTKGDYRSAIVFRFRAGILKLEKGPQPTASRQTNRVISSSAPNTFPPIATTFDGVRYGDAPGSAHDADRSKQEWPKVVSEARQQVVAHKTAAKYSVKQKRRGRR